MMEILCNKKSYTNSNASYQFNCDSESKMLMFCKEYLKTSSQKNTIPKEELKTYACKFGQNLIKAKNSRVFTNKYVIGNTLHELTSLKLSEILSCSDFMEIFNGSDGDKKKQLTGLLGKHKEVKYDNIKTEVEASSLSLKNKKVFFVKVLPSCDFKICSEFDSTWDMFKDGYIDFNALVTKLWTRKDFDQNIPNQNNAFQNFAKEYNKYLNHEQLSDKNSVRDCAIYMVDELERRDDTLKGNTQNLKNRINYASNVGIFGVIAQFFANLFSKGKTAFQSVSKTKQDRVISNLKSCSKMFRPAMAQDKIKIRKAK